MNNNVNSTHFSSVMGLDIAKNIFHVYTLGADGKVLKKKLKRAEVLTFFANYTASLIGIEACGGSHHWARAVGWGEVTNPNITCIPLLGFLSSPQPTKLQPA